MTSAATIGQRVDRITAVRSDTTADPSVLKLALLDAEKVRAWADAQTAAIVGRLAAIESCPEQTIADTSRCGLGGASRTRERADTLADTPNLADALEGGAITAGHVDAVTRARKKLDTPEGQQAFTERVDDLVDVAAAATISAFAKRLDREVKKLQTGSGEERLTRQKKQNRVRTWTDDEGMWNLHGRFDPTLALGISAALDDAVAARFAQQTPEHCPTDPVEKQQFLNAHALAGLLGADTTDTTDTSTADVDAKRPCPCGQRPNPTARPEFVSVIDIDANPGHGPLISHPIPVEMPLHVLVNLYPDADHHTVVVRNGIVMHAPGNMNLGRTTRLASKHQRRALRALYSCCAVPGCSVAFDRCKIHHIIWWRNGGRTDLHNLLPVCSRHHSTIHADDWHISLGPNRELHIRLADGRTMTTGPPTRHAA